MILENPIDVLGDSEKSIIEGASEFLKLGIPSADLIAEKARYRSTSMIHIDELSNLKSVVEFTKSKLQLRLAEAELVALEDIRDEYSKSTDINRALLIDNKCVDIKTQIGALTSISSRLSDLGWSLTHAYKIV